MNAKPSFYLVLLLMMLLGCQNAATPVEDQTRDQDPIAIVLEAEDFSDASTDYQTVEDPVTSVQVSRPGWLIYELPIGHAGRYRISVRAQTDHDSCSVWIEDYVDNRDERTYNITGSIAIVPGRDFGSFHVDGSPLDDTLHRIKLHINGNNIHIDRLTFTLLRPHEITPTTYTQRMDGTEWKLVWSDEFNDGMVDSTKWTYDIGNWGWGNNELQYYTEHRRENARIEDGKLIIEAIKNSTGPGWTSARLTTRGKASFLYGKIEFRAQVPREKGNWAAGWTLGDGYVDELSWPYCGEIDILESVGYEVDNESGDGIAHATVHTPAYYFKINNQISSTKEVANIAGAFHTYAVEWEPTEIRGYVDGEQYYTYDKTANALEWPFHLPQNIILNLAMGGGWGGAKGMDENVTSQKFMLDYVRVYALE